jgi:hypothetical protein
MCGVHVCRWAKQYSLMPGLLKEIILDQLLDKDDENGLVVAPGVS